MADSSEDCMDRRMAKGVDFQGGGAAIGSAKKMLAVSEVEGLGKVMTNEKPLGFNVTLDDISRVEESGCQVNLGSTFGPKFRNPTEMGMGVGQHQTNAHLDLGPAVDYQQANAPPTLVPVKVHNNNNSVNGCNNNSDIGCGHPLGAGSIAEQTCNMKKPEFKKGKKARKMKKLVLAESEEFFQDMESEADRLASAQEVILSRRSKRREKRRRKSLPKSDADTTVKTVVSGPKTVI